MANLPIRELVLYKSGIGYFVRAGEYSGDTLTMTFDKGEINDVLKSLNVVDQSGGQVVGIHYDTPTTAAGRSQWSRTAASIWLSPRAKLLNTRRSSQVGAIRWGGSSPG